MGFVYGHKDSQVRKLFKVIQGLREEEEQANGEAEHEEGHEEGDEDEEEDDEPDAQAWDALDAAYGEEDGDTREQEPEMVTRRGESEPDLDS